MNHATRSAVLLLLLLLAGTGCGTDEPASKVLPDDNKSRHDHEPAPKLVVVPLTAQREPETGSLLWDDGSVRESEAQLSAGLRRLGTAPAGVAVRSPLSERNAQVRPRASVLGGVITNNT